MEIKDAVKILEDEKKLYCLIESYGDGDTEWAKSYDMAINSLLMWEKILNELAKEMEEEGMSSYYRFLRDMRYRIRDKLNSI